MKCTNCDREIKGKPEYYKDEPLCERCFEQIKRYEQAMEYEQMAREVMYASVKRDD
jgi:hypothetical protein